MAEPAPGAFNMDNSGIAFALVFAAAGSTAIGASAVFFKGIVKLASKPILAIGLGFSAGVMLYVSFIEIFVKSLDAFRAEREEDDAYFCATLCLFAGMALLRMVQFVVHRIEGGHAHVESDVLEDAREFTLSGPPLTSDRQDLEDPAPQPQPTGVAPPAGADAAKAAPPGKAAQGEDEATSAAAAAAVLERRESRRQAEKAAQLQRMGLNTAIAISIHNFPEGLATFVATLVDPSVGATLAIAIGVHNIPEGLCVALPIYYATDSRLKGFLFALISGISEPIGALIGWLVIRSTGDDMSQLVYGILFGLVAGMMIMICVLELLPTAYSYDPTDKYVTHSIGAGMAVMAASLCLFMV